MLYVDDKLPRHPKIFRAGSMLGKNGPARALAMFLDGLSYAREHLTDGFIPDRFVASCVLVECPLDVAKVLVDRRIRLWHRERGGYRIHDYHDWNRSANEIKEKREKERHKKAAQRAGKNGHEYNVSPDVSLGDKLRTSCARASTYHDPRTTYHGTGVELVPPIRIGRYEKKNKPPRFARRDSYAVENSDDPRRNTTTDPIPPGLCHSQDGAPSQSDTERPRVERTHQDRGIQAGVSEHRCRDVVTGDDSGRICARESVRASASDCTATPTTSDGLDSGTVRSVVETQQGFSGVGLHLGSDWEDDRCSSLRAIVTRARTGS